MAWRLKERMLPPTPREEGHGVTGNAILSVPTLLTANPAGSIVAHATMHVTAVAHAYETPTYLPPQTSAR
jgi:hypothetical protein